MSLARLSLVFLVALALALAAPSPVSAGDENKKKDDEEEVDYLALSARLVRDGYYDRAENTLREVDLTDPELDKKLYFVLRGLVSMHKKLYRDAAESFDNAIQAGNHEPLVYINLARARFGSKDYAGTVKALDGAGKAAHDEPSAEMIGAQAYWELHRPGEALAIVQRARKRFTDQLDFSRLEIHYLLELGLYQELARRRSAFAQRDDIVADDLAAIGEALRGAGRTDESIQTLEVARLRFPDNEKLTVLLSRAYMDKGKLLSSAILLEEASRMDPKYLIEAAEMYRRAGRLTRALFINKRVIDQKAKMKQRLQILLERQDFEQISAMEARLSRLGLLGDEQIRYALAYGFFQIKDFDSAERHIRGLRDADLFQKGIELRKAIQSCKDAGWMCR